MLEIFKELIVLGQLVDYITTQMLKFLSFQVWDM